MPSPLTHRSHAHRRRGTLAALLVAVVLAAAACGGSKETSADRESAPTSVTKGAQTIEIDTFMFMPKLVNISVGDTVKWKNNDSILHTVTSGTREYDPTNSGLVTATHKDGMFDLQLDGRGAVAQFTFTEAGTFHFFCDRHPGMEADIEVS